MLYLRADIPQDLIEIYYYDPLKEAEIGGRGDEAVKEAVGSLDDWMRSYVQESATRFELSILRDIQTEKEKAGGRSLFGLGIWR